MSVAVMTAVFANSKSKGAARLVLLALADEAGSDGQVTAYRRSQSHLAQKCCLSVRGVRKAIDDLVALGELSVIAEGDGRKSADYLISVEGGTTFRPQGNVVPPREEPRSAPSSRSSPVTPVVGESAIRKAKRSLPEQWTPGDAEREAATNAGMAPEHRREQWDQFRDHHAAKGSVMADWPAAWRTWCRNWRKFNPTLASNAHANQADAHAGHRHAGRIMYDGANNRVEIQDDGSHKIIATSEEVTAELNAADWNDLA